MSLKVKPLSNFDIIELCRKAHLFKPMICKYSEFITDEYFSDFNKNYVCAFILYVYRDKPDTFGHWILVMKNIYFPDKLIYFNSGGDSSPDKQSYKRELNGPKESILKIAKKYGYDGIEYNTKKEQIQCADTDTCGYHCFLRYMTYYKFNLLKSGNYVRWIKKMAVLCKCADPDHFVFKLVNIILHDTEENVQKYCQLL